MWGDAVEIYPQRKKNRLDSALYRSNGSCFITICTREKRNLFWQPSVGAALRRPPDCLNANGQIVQREIVRFADIYDGVVTVDHAVVMPNHVHRLLSIHSQRLGGRRNAAPTISSVVNQFKGSVTKAVGAPCWQKSFHDHIVRGESDYLRIWEYIDSNPGKWTEDRYYIPDDG